MITRHTYFVLLGLTVLFTFLNFVRFHDAYSADLMASWIAGHFFDAGQIDQIYRVDTDYYTITPPVAWWSYLDSIGMEEDAYPYVYPPLWAALIAPLTRVLDIQTVQSVATLANPVFLCASIVLALRAAGRSVTEQVTGLVVGYLIVSMSLIGEIALNFNQPQIFVSFLLVLAVERMAAKDDRTAGIALGLAAALKVYPVVFALILLVAGRFRVVGWFAVTGAVLGAMSVALAGWPLHRIFLDQLSVMGRTAILSPIVYSLDATIAQYLPPEMIHRIFSPPAESGRQAPVSGWAAIVKTPFWIWANRALLLALVAGGGWLLRKRAHQSALVWATIFTAYGLIGPLSWSHHYLTAAAFAPLLVMALPRNAGILLLAGFFLPVSVVLAIPVSTLSHSYLANQFAGTIAVIVLLTGYVLALFRTQRNISGPIE